MSEVNLFADDTCLFVSGTNKINTEIKCNRVLDLLKKWLCSNKLTINLEKTHFVDFTKNKKDYNFTLKYNDILIQQKETTKYLGLALQQDLNWNIHINNIVNKLNSLIPLFYQIRDILSKNKKIMIYKSLALSKIIYGIELYSKNSNKWLQLLQSTQSRLLKILLNKTLLFRTNSIHNICNIPKIADIAKIRLALHSHKFTHHKESTNVALSNMRSMQHHRILRNNLNLAIDTNYYQRRCKVIETASIIWNSLNQDLKAINNRTLFKNSLTNYFIDHYT